MSGMTYQRFAIRRRGKFPHVSEDRVCVQIGAGGVATVTMVRADKHNALDQAMFEGLMDAAGQLAHDASVRAVVLHGEGKSFCSGLDIASFMSGQGGTGVLLTRDGGRVANFAQRVTYDWSLVPAPVIAAIHGNCFGGGLQIALRGDILIAAPDAKLSIMKIKWGLVPDMGITQTLPRLLPIDVAKELTFTGRIVSGSEALALGLVTRNRDDPLASALALAEEIAQKSPDAIRAAKRLYAQTWASDDSAGALKLESELQAGLIGKPNQIAAVVAGMSGGQPVFVDPPQRWAGYPTGLARVRLGNLIHHDLVGDAAQRGLLLNRPDRLLFQDGGDAGRVDNGARDVDLLASRQALHPCRDIDGLAEIVLALVQHHRKTRPFMDSDLYDQVGLAPLGIELVHRCPPP